MRKTRFAAIFVLMCWVGLAVASEGDEIKLDHAPINRFDTASIQRGAQLFTNYCLSCHSAHYMHYRGFKDLGLSEEQIKKNLLMPGSKLTDEMKVALKDENAKEWLGTVPPDLTLIARARGADWLYSYLRGFYRDSQRPTGWNNIVFHNVGMPNVLWQHSGQGTLASQKFDSLEEARGEALRTLGPTAIKMERAQGDEPAQYVLEKVVVPQSDSQNAEKYNQDVTDIVNFLAFMADPGYISHRQTGRFVVIALAFAVMAAYIVKREYWKDIR